MNPVDEYARLKVEIRRLQDRAEILREVFRQPGAGLRSNRDEITLRRQRRVFSKYRLPASVLEDPRYREERESEVVLCREISTFRAGDEELRLIE